MPPKTAKKELSDYEKLEVIRGKIYNDLLLEYSLKNGFNEERGGVINGITPERDKKVTDHSLGSHVDILKFASGTTDKINGSYNHMWIGNKANITSEDFLEFNKKIMKAIKLETDIYRREIPQANKSVGGNPSYYNITFPLRYGSPYFPKTQGNINAAELIRGRTLTGFTIYFYHKKDDRIDKLVMDSIAPNFEESIQGHYLNEDGTITPIKKRSLRDITGVH